MYKSSSAASNLLKRASSSYSSSPSTWRWSHSPATFSSQIRASSSQISSTGESEHVFKGYLTGFPKPGGGNFGKFYGSHSLSDPRIDKLPYSVRSFHQSATRFQDTVASTGTEQRSGSGGGSKRGGWASKALKNLNPFYHIEAGIKDILKDYVHHKMTLTWILVWFRLFIIIVTKDVFLALIFP